MDGLCFKCELLFQGVYELKSFAVHNVPVDSLAQQLSQINNNGGTVLGTFYNVIGVANIGKLC